MIIVDVNLLLYAVISGFPQHENARTWWESVLNSAMVVGLTSPAVFGFLRIATNPRVLESPLPIETASRYLREWLELPNVQFVTPGPRHLDIAFDLLAQAGTAGSLTTDAQLAAIAIECDAEMFSNDSDFGRFPVVKWVNPLR
jgi:uncharacterized protein